ncbi:MAG: hypothetical protein LH660_17510 [Phormidesmis sp. CAN_BIN36]|nr:hypothetical protein [Phormidesmis sp. CAN_BIN36]
MSEDTKQPTDNAEVVRKLIVPPTSLVKIEDGDRSPTKTERDLTTEVIAKLDRTPIEEGEVVRRLVVPTQPSESGDEDGDRSPTKTERDLSLEAIAQSQQETIEEVQPMRTLIVPNEQ